MRAHWFANMAPSDNSESLSSAQSDAIEKAETLFRHVAQVYFEDEATSQETSNPTAVPSTTTGQTGYLASICDVRVPQRVATASSPQDRFRAEVKRYLEFEGGLGDLLDPLAWWKVIRLVLWGEIHTDAPLFNQVHDSSFPTIARMARDFLAIPATSVSVERTFSKSRHICSDLRSSLKAQTITEALLSKVWIRSGLFEVNPPIVKKRKHGAP
jgi:hAT family C-terminal dimerisation region